MPAEPASGPCRAFNGPYAGACLDRVAFPLGGLGAGMICLEGCAALSHFSLRGRPEIFHEPFVFSALSLQGSRPRARVLEGPVPNWKIFFPWGEAHNGAGGGSRGKSYGLPRFAQAGFKARFPFATVSLGDPEFPLAVEVTGWSPFLPGSADASSLPVCALEYRILNPTAFPIEAVYSFHASNFLSVGKEAPGAEVRRIPDGLLLWQPPTPEKPWLQGACAISSDAGGLRVDAAWFRGGWFDSRTRLWETIARAESPDREAPRSGEPSSGGSLYVPLRLAPGAEQTVRVRLAWYLPVTNLKAGSDPQPPEGACCSDGTCGPRSAPAAGTHLPWYAARFGSVEAVAAHWREGYDSLRAGSLAFSEALFDSTLPPEAVEAVAANLAILKSPTVLRCADGRLWLWEGCSDKEGCCHGSCTHVWNYAQALAHLFPDLERGLRETEHLDAQDARGHQDFRTNLPIRPSPHTGHAAADGQLGGIMKVYREWRIGGDLEWLRRLWPRVRSSLDFCIRSWDPGREGVLREPHHNTYDIEFWGPEGMCASIYLGALQAAIRMGQALGEEVEAYRDLLDKGKRYLEERLFNGEFFVQEIQYQGLQAADPTRGERFEKLPEEAQVLLREEGPKYQYGQGCLADGVLGEWLAAVCGLPGVLDPAKVEAHLRSVFRHNFREDLREHANPQRPTYALGAEGGLLLCTWPRGGRLGLPFPYSEEVWTGIEYQVASHLILRGGLEEGLRIVRAARARYDGTVRNPFNEYECGHWYGRALSSYGLLQALSGARYDAVEKVLYLRPGLPGDFRAFLATARGYGTVGVAQGRPFLEVRAGEIQVERIAYTAYGKGGAGA